MAVSYGTYTITEVQEGSQIWTSSAAPTTPNYTFDVSKLVGDSETSIKSGDIIMHSYNRYTVLSVSSDGKTVLAGNLQSIRGATGAASVTYTLIVSNLAIVKDKDGNLSPSTITVTAKSQTGSNAMANYTGRIKIETTTNNSTWTSRINEDAATKTYTIPSDTVAIRCSLYLKGGTTTLLDQQTIPVVSDGTDGINGINGKDGADGKDAYTVILTNENHTFAGNTTSAIASEIECNIIAYKGTTQIAATIGTITGQPTGMTTEILNNGKTNASFKVNVTTSMITKNGILNIPITVDGKAFTKKFTYTLTLDGEKGDKGDRGTNGASQNLLLDAYAPSLARVDAPSSRYLSDASNSTITGEFIAEDNLPDPNATHFYRITDSSATTKGRGLYFYGSSTPPFIAGHTYRIGCWVRKHAGSPKMNITLGSHGSWMPTQRIIDNTDWEWIEVVRTFGDTTSADKTPIPDTYKRLYFYFYNNNVAGSSLDMCGFRMEELQTNSGTARNLLLDTEKLTNWGVVNGATISDGVASFPSITANSWREIYPAKNFKYELIRNQYAIFSIKVKGNVDEKCCVNLCIGVDTTETAYARKKYFSQYIYFIGTGEWQTVCSALPIFDYMFNTGSGTVDFDNCWVTVRIGAVNNYWNGFQAKEPQLCLGTTATSWSRAPEDIDEAIDNIEVGGRNLVWNSNFHLPVEETWNNWGSPTKREIVTIDGENWMHIVTTANSYQGYSQTQANRNGFGEIQAGEQIVFSFDAYSKVDGQEGCIGIHWCNSNNTTVNQNWASFNLTTTKKRYVTNAFTVPDNAVGFNIMVGQRIATAQELWITNIKGEKGNKATDWTPAPEDVDADIEEAKKVATNYLSADNTGIMVADMEDGEQTPSTATGKNVFIDNDSVDIRNGQTVLSSFGNGIVTLGEADKARLELTTGSIKGISNQGVINFDITGQNIDGDGTLNDSGILTNQATDEDRENGILFKATFRPNLNLNNYDSLTGSINFIFNNNERTYNFSYDVPDTEPWAIVIPYEEVVAWRAHYKYGVDMIGSYYTFTFVDLGSQSDIIVDDTVSYNISITSIDYHDSSFSFGSRATDYSVGSNSCIIGEELVATSANQVAIGRYNYDNTEKYPNKLNRRYAFMVGNGFLGAGRNNAFAVDWNGRVETGDIQATGLLLEENSKSEMDDYIKCVSAGDADIFKVNKNGIINAAGRINAPNANFVKPSSNNADYIQCGDTDNNVNFQVLHDGSVIVGNDLLVGNSQTVTNNLTVGGNETITGGLTVSGTITDTSNSYSLIKNLNVDTFKLSTRTPVYRKRFYWTAEIGANSSWSRIGTNASLDGYTPVGVVSFGCFNASSGASSNVDWCVITKCYVWSTTLDVYVWNQNTGASARCGVYVDVLYFAIGMI